MQIWQSDDNSFLEIVYLTSISAKIKLLDFINIENSLNS